MKVREFYDFARKNLPLADEKELKNEANILLQFCLKLDFTELFLQRERTLTEKELEFLENAIFLRKSGVPVQYILGSWEFMNMNLKVGEGVLSLGKTQPFWSKRLLKTLALRNTLI